MTLVFTNNFTEFSKVKPLDAFVYKGELFIKLPELRCTVRECIDCSGKSREFDRKFNAIRIKKNNFYGYDDYFEFKNDDKVITLYSELRITDIPKEISP